MALTAERYEMHGMSRSPEYRAWEAMIQRCTNPNDPSYMHYGGRGIEVCERWRGSFTLFLHDMGKRPSGDSELDRVDNERGYEPGNVWWMPRRLHRLKHGQHKVAALIRGEQMKALTRCINGHEFTEENTYRNKHGYRSCRICRKAAESRRRRREVA